MPATQTQLPVTATPADDARRCPSCGCFLAADDPSPVCTPCVSSYRSSRRSGYRPAHDAELRSRLLSVLLRNRGRRVNVYQALGMWPGCVDEWTAVKVHVRLLRRHGHDIIGYHDGTYLYAGMVGPGSSRRREGD